jgi:hypothetical protein
MRTETDMRLRSRLDANQRDREQSLRIELDSPGGFFIRFQYLDIPLSAAEQASFLSRYGSWYRRSSQPAFSALLNRILFLQEAANVLDGIHVHFRLKRSYAAADIGHFRAFTPRRTASLS